MLISQIRRGGARAVVAREGPDAEATVVNGAASTYDLAREALEAGATIAERIAARGLGEAVDLAAALERGEVALPIEHPEPSRMHLTGTGLTHLGSASTRDAMHAAASADETDSMRMFRMGVEGGKPAEGVGAQPEWFWKGNGLTAVSPGASLVSPAFAEDGGEEPEVAGVYLVGPDGAPARVGWALANEFSDHVTERVNYLWLAHSKLRPCSFGPEILLGPLPGAVEGTSRILRDGAVVWEKPFLSGEDHMSHAVANLEHHHFKYALHRRPGDVHVHMMGTATLSFADGVRAEPGDVFEVSAQPFGLPLRNPLAMAEPEAVRVRAL